MSRQSARWPSTPSAYLDAFMRFYCEGEFDDSPVIDTVPRIIARPFEQWADATLAYA